jgi:surface antigen
MNGAMNLQASMRNRLPIAVLLLLSAVLSGCNTTSGSTRLDDTGSRLADSDSGGDAPEQATFYIQALKGGLVARIPGLKISKSDRARALEAEYKALEMSPAGQKIVWDGSNGVHGEVLVAAPYQVGSQNCRQYAHSIAIDGNAPATARGAACRNADGSWSPLS